MKAPRHGNGGGARFAGCANLTPRADGSSDASGGAPRYAGATFVRQRSPEPITGDDVRQAVTGWVDTPINPPQTFYGGPPPTPISFEPIRRSLRMVHRHYNVEQGVRGSSRFLRVVRLVLGSHERQRGTVTPQRIRAGRMRTRLTVQPSTGSYSEQTEVFGG